MPDESTTPYPTIVVEQSMLTLACTFLIGIKVERIPYTSNNGKVSDDTLIKMGEFLSYEPHIFPKPIRDSMAGVQIKTMKKVEKHEEDIKQLLQEVKDLKELVADYGEPKPKNSRVECE